jgi:hypothetical protein
MASRGKQVSNRHEQWMRAKYTRNESMHSIRLLYAYVLFQRVNKKANNSFRQSILKHSYVYNIYYFSYISKLVRVCMCVPHRLLAKYTNQIWEGRRPNPRSDRVLYSFNTVCFSFSYFIFCRLLFQGQTILFSFILFYLDSFIRIMHHKKKHYSNATSLLFFLFFYFKYLVDYKPSVLIYFIIFLFL